MRLPGCHRQRELRCWSISRLAEEAGVHWCTARKADRGEGIRPTAAEAIMGAFERTPAPRVARELEPAT
jgi:hypothetical protein